jgi:hypothetical protein
MVDQRCRVGKNAYSLLYRLSARGSVTGQNSYVFVMYTPAEKLVEGSRKMKPKELTLPELALIAGTRGMLGAGIGLLLSGKLSKEQRRAAGWTLVAVGAMTTIPLVMAVFGNSK